MDCFFLVSYNEQWLSGLLKNKHLNCFPQRLRVKIIRLVATQRPDLTLPRVYRSLWRNPVVLVALMVRHT